MTIETGMPWIAKTATGSVFAAILLLAAAPMAMADDAQPKPIVKTLLQSTTWGDGKPLAYPSGTPMITSRLVEIPPGGETGRHRHSLPLFAYILEGELTIVPDDQEARVFKAGDAFMEVSVWHNGRNQGSTPVRLLSVYAGAEGVPLAEKP